MNKGLTGVARTRLGARGETSGVGILRVKHTGARNRYKYFIEME